MRTLKALSLIISIFILAQPIQAQVVKRKNSVNSQSIKKSAPKKIANKPQTSAERGWDFLKAKLLKDGISEWEIRSVYDNKKMPAMGVVYFSLNPKEVHAMYAVFYNEAMINSAREFLFKNKQIFEAAEKKYKVTRYVIAAILLVETQFGANTGDSLIINRLSRVGGIAKPSNITEVYNKLNKEDDQVTYKQVEDRALHLEERFYPEILALFHMSRKYKVNLLELKGSPAGAFGMPQFLPSTFMNYAVDGDGDRRISLFNRADAIHSTANYLSKSGWSDDAKQAIKEEVIWKYNHSQPYIDTILSIAIILANP